VGIFAKTATGSVFDVSADGKRFLVLDTGGEDPATPITIVLNWQATSKK
jgi:hypothetical protein